MHKSAHSILIVDDSKDIRDSLATYLRRNGFRIVVAEDAAAARLCLREAAFDLVLLDIMMPGEDGFSLCRWLLANKDTPVIFLTAMTSETDRIVGLELGADDYVVKPFNPRELLARVRVALRRRAPKVDEVEFKVRKFDEWLHDSAQNELRSENGNVVELTTYENRLLSILLDHPNTVLSRAVLLDYVVGREEKAYDRAIDNQIGRLRKKLEQDASNPTLLRTVWGGGYQLVAVVTELGGE
ncbi:two-component system, OmpR family, response regulator [Octadecabacter temperatus]|uniref:Transcriptional regulatory protein OmpR n=1 Tax=Octadecabacter temperatus TaxID=1458307 RepID=A0A0K0Y2I6_9RHOB|nr:response regulator transcription factor [Octadecabacter temperatus]AKS45135.1 Transcriptional regulatory protein OmpR [Octadecabacter temperatus]SIN86853.1 two-component system, OmpR family, response regulator [Octadecabacter temperatus]